MSSETASNNPGFCPVKGMLHAHLNYYKVNAQRPACALVGR